MRDFLSFCAAQRFPFAEHLHHTHKQFHRQSYAIIVSASQKKNFLKNSAAVALHM